jgi:probable phosphoglycerate mutase
MTGDAAQEATRIIVIRHGETAWNVDNRIQGQLDIPLNAVGREQARRVGEALAGEDIAAIYSSDLLRAFETAAAVAPHIGRSIVPEPGLRERGFGEFEGLTFTEIEARWPEASARWRQRDPGFGPPAGEVLTDFHARCVATATRLAAAHAGEVIVIVAHGGVLDSLYRAASRIALDAPRSWQVGNASLNRLLYSPQGFALVGWSDRHHLDGMVRDDASIGPAAVRRGQAA